MLRSILVPLDGSSFSEHALPWALALARRANAHLQLVHVHQKVAPSAVAGLAVPTDPEDRLHRQEHAYLAEAVKRLTAVAPVAVETALVEDGEVARAIQDRALQSHADLVVMSTHGRGALARFWLGSVADELVRYLPLPLLLIRPEVGAVDLKVEPQLRHILVPLDGTTLAEGALAPALALGRLAGARYTLLRVVNPVVRPEFLSEGSTIQGLHDSKLPEVRRYQRQMEDEATMYVEGVARRMREHGDSVDTQVLIDEWPALAILHETQALNADLIAMETHGRRGLSGLILGSIADKVVRGTTRPVLLLRPRSASGLASGAA